MDKIIPKKINNTFILYITNNKYEKKYNFRILF